MHNLEGDKTARLVDVCQGLFLTTGQDVTRFDEASAVCLGARHAIGLSSAPRPCISRWWRSASAGGEVITTPMTFARPRTRCSTNGNASLLTEARSRWPSGSATRL